MEEMASLRMEKKWVDALVKSHRTESKSLPGLKPEKDERGDAAAAPYGLAVEPSADVFS